MKKLKFLLFICFVFVGLLLAGCSNGKESNEDVINKINEWVLENYKEGVSESIELPTECPLYKGSQIQWFSDDPFTMDNSGAIVERGKKAQNVDFTYVIIYDGEQKEFTRTFIVTGVTFDRAVERFESQFPKYIFEDQNWTVLYDSVISVSWESSNTDVFTNEGVYIKPEEDTNITITYTITDGNTSLTKTKELLVQGKTALDYFAEAEEWLSTEFMTDTYLTSDISLPTTYKDKVEINWNSTDTDALNLDGKIRKTLYERYVNLTAKLQINESVKSYTFTCLVEAMDSSNMTKQEKLEEFIRIITVDEIGKLVFDEYGNITQCYNYIHFFQTGKVDVIENYIPEGLQNRPGTIRSSIEYICVHDTANNAQGATALANSNYVKSGYGGSETSWHYTVGNDGVYIQIPIEEVAYHAGDSIRKFALDDTGIKATAKRPIITLDENGYYAINGVSTKLRPYADKAATTFTDTVYTTDDLGYMSITCEIGANGNYFLGRTYYSTSFARISNFGGNYNSIGIESAVNSGSDYSTTVRTLAKLVAELCLTTNLGVDRVQPHHYFSGKPCGHAFLSANYWYNFKNLVSLEKYAMENFSDYTFTWTSNTDLVDSMGRISLSAKSGDKLAYSVIVKNGENVLLDKSFTTVIK